MRFATVRAGTQTLGVVVSPSGSLHPLPGSSVDQLVALGLSRALEIGAEALRSAPIASEVTFLAPVRPTCVRDFVTFESHVEGVRRSVDGSSGVPDAWYDAPTFYFTNPHTIVGPSAEVRRPWGCSALDFELEVACVLGSGGTSLTEAGAAQAIFGYTIFNDWSARDLQSRELKVGLGPAKGKDFCTSIGPWLVTADEFASRHDADGFLDLACTVSVNGTGVGHDRLTSMGWTFPTMIAYASRDSVVAAGDLLASGTTGGGGCLAELWGRAGTQDPPPLEPGDVVAITVDGLGTLTTTVAEGHPVPPLTPFRK
ncbi:fumarylacetoacetate hydrolase family protein [Paractinoplanes atraurantiacus]|uniref:2-keto-4-pentenoate hydratase/2-oxohepta-3-ene-1,7-dioic acid hydratase (Catechol pathway) n=1 Tax=Paractinoplanes atraurantiacus TaxID=1036182 RepID=A0A285K2K1_9ACTN|nr:fumarylacetoacetate hydrolase family protein [Actinoplanes atraurantiacus]SNY65571.1 2-keto-4-pentenoate hydratase/2-oxohepta-3-ene-1,7-dioic acid hydratase (catechol pathway) [Actinoplanes atraurantiacus]